MDVDTDPFSFDLMRDQLDWIQQANLDYEENKSSCSWLHFLTRSFENKSKNSSDSKPKSIYVEIQNLWTKYFKNNWKEQDLINYFSA